MAWFTQHVVWGVTQLFKAAVQPFMTTLPTNGYFFQPSRVGCHRGEPMSRAMQARPPTSPRTSSDRFRPYKSWDLMIMKHNHAHRSWGRPWTRSIWLGAALCGLLCFLGRRSRRLADSNGWTAVLENGLAAWPGTSTM